MKNKAIILLLAMTTALTGCAVPGVEKNVNDESVEAAQEATNATNETQEDSASSASTESDVLVDPEKKANTSWDDPYEAFLAGEGTLSIKYYMDNVFKDTKYLSYEDEVIQLISADKEYTIKEFKDALNATDNTPNEIESMSYAFLDCGADGNKELALVVVGPFVEPSSTMTFVIKEIDGKLQVVYAFAQWSRSSTDLNEYGMLTGFGSGGATLHGWDAAYINADGKYLFGYCYEEESELDKFAGYKEHDDYDTSDLEGTICVYELQLAPYEEISDGNLYYSYSVYRDYHDKIEDPKLYTDSPYQKVMDSFKEISFITEDEMDKLAADKLKTIGITDKIKSGLDLEYKEIDFDKEYVHDTTADYYKIPSNLQEELAIVELRSVGYENADWDYMGQQPSNYTSYQWYKLWDNELNDLWGRITSQIDPDKKQALVEEQRAWVKRKEDNVYEAGADFEGGTMQPFLENSCAKSFTRKRCYELAAVLAEIRGEEFQVSEEVAESYKDVDLTLEEVFERFEGQWIFDESRGACLGVEKSGDYADYAPKGSTWVVWETGGDIISDLDVISFTDYTIIFMVPRDGYDSYYKLRFNGENEAELLYATSMEELNEQG